jgi:hypothetical protein
MELVGSSLLSQELSTCSYPEPGQSSTYHPILSLQDPFTHLDPDLPSGLLPSSFPINNLYTFIFTLIRAICLAHLILLDFIILIILGEEHKS